MFIDELRECAEEVNVVAEYGGVAEDVDVVRPWREVDVEEYRGESCERVVE